MDSHQFDLFARLFFVVVVVFFTLLVCLLVCLLHYTLFLSWQNHLLTVQLYIYVKQRSINYYHNNTKGIFSVYDTMNKAQNVEDTHKFSRPVLARKRRERGRHKHHVGSWNVRNKRQTQTIHKQNITHDRIHELYRHTKINGRTKQNTSTLLQSSNDDNKAKKKERTKREPANAVVRVVQVNITQQHFAALVRMVEINVTYNHTTLCRNTKVTQAYSTDRVT